MSHLVSMSITELFYRRLLKSNLNLDERARIADCLASCAREEKGHEWSSIVVRKNSYKQALLFLFEYGYLKLELRNKAELVSQLNSLAESQPPESLIEIQHLRGVSDLPAVQSLMNDSRLHDLVSLYLNAPARLYNVIAWWQNPMGESHIPSNAQKWHRDRDDFSFLKLFLYCTDVDIDSGPHAYLPKSHISSNLSQLFSTPSVKSDLISGQINDFYSDSQLDSCGFSGQRKVWIGPAGTCFFEDTRGLHRAYPPHKMPRLMFSMVWTIGPGFNSGLT